MLKFKEIKLEQISKEESQYESYKWNKGCFNFLLQRVGENYIHQKNSQRRLAIESSLNMKLPPIEDHILIELYKYACNKYQKSCNRNFNEHSGFQKTTSEHQFLKTIEAVIKSNPDFKYIEIYPSISFSKDLPTNHKVVIGSYVPDFILFGFKTSKASAVVIEIDGDSHINKLQKDLLRDQQLSELRIFTFSVPNEQAQDSTYIHRVFKSLHRKRSGALDKQIQRTKRMIWIKTISCHLSFAEIENFVFERSGVRLNLESEATSLLGLDNCPRKIKVELLRSGYAASEIKNKVSSAPNPEITDPSR